MTGAKKHMSLDELEEGFKDKLVKFSFKPEEIEVK